jgi:hypothetical protein
LWQIVGFVRQQREIYDAPDDQLAFFFSVHHATWITTRCKIPRGNLTNYIFGIIFG